MTPILEGWNLTVVGSWNLAIFSPVWLGREIFQADEIEVKMSLPPQERIHFKSGNLELVVQPNQIVCFPGSFDDDALQDVSSKVLSIVDTLPHTPILGIGINFRYQVSDPDEALIARVNDSDATHFADHEFILRHFQTRRKLSIPDEQAWVCNLVIGNEIGSEISFDLNFHADVNSASRVTELLGNKFTGFKSVAENTIMGTIFGQGLD